MMKLKIFLKKSKKSIKINFLKFFTKKVKNNLQMKVLKHSEKNKVKKKNQ